MINVLAVLVIFTLAAGVITYIYSHKKSIQILDDFCGVEPIGLKKIYINGKLKSIECNKRDKNGVCMQSNKACCYP